MHSFDVTISREETLYYGSSKMNTVTVAVCELTAMNIVSSGSLYRTLKFKIRTWDSTLIHVDKVLLMTLKLLIPWIILYYIFTIFAGGGNPPPPPLVLHVCMYIYSRCYIYKQHYSVQPRPADDTVERDSERWRKSLTVNCHCCPHPDCQD